MDYSKTKVNFKNSQYNRSFVTVEEPTVEAMNTLRVDTDKGVVFINMNEVYCVEYKES